MENTRAGDQDRTRPLQGQIVEERMATIGDASGSAETDSNAKRLP
jgi:hypothetical protein